MQSQRNLLLIAWLFVSFMLWQLWTVYKNPPPPAPAPQETALVTTTQSDDLSSSAGQLIQVKTDVLSLSINTTGGDIEVADLLKYNEALKSEQPFRLLDNTSAYSYVARSGLVGNDGPDNAVVNKGRPVYKVAQNEFVLPSDAEELKVPLTFVNDKGVEFTKTFTFKRGEYVVRLDYTVNNKSDKPVEVALFGQLRQSVEPPKGVETSNNFALRAYRGTAYSTDEDKYKKFSFSDIEDNNLNETTTGGWIAMLQQYFATAWVPNQTIQTQFTTSYQPKGDLATISFRNAPVEVAANSEKTLGAKLWVGPEDQDTMGELAPHLNLTVDYGWLWFISQPLFKLLTFIQSMIGNWGVSIIIITFIVRGLMYPLTKAQYTSMAKMKLLQPKIQEMRERFGDDRQRMSQEMMALYQKEKVNPLGGCFPILIQMPIFIALYYMLMSSVELRHAPFMLWLQDLSAQDPYYILPLLMGGTMFLIQKMSPTPVTDPMQQKIMTFMPVIFTVFFLWFPSGLVLYYIVSNLVTIIQQQLIYRGLEKRGLHSRDKK